MPQRRGLATICAPATQTEETLRIYGNVSVVGPPVPARSSVEVSTPRGNVVGSFVVTVAGSYGPGFIYGERTVQGVGTLPGLKDDESPVSRVNGVLLWPVGSLSGGAAGCAETRIDLGVVSPATSTPTPSAAATRTPIAGAG